MIVLIIFSMLVVLKQIFDSFDLEKKGEIGVEMIGQILDMLGHQLNPEELAVSNQHNQKTIFIPEK